MKIRKVEILSMAYLYVLLISFLPLLVKGMLHVQGGSYIPMIVINILGLPVLIGLYYGKTWVTFFIKAWAVWLMVYGVVRILLQALVGFLDGAVEAEIIGQLTFSYLFMSLAHFAVGYCLYRYLYSCVWVAEDVKPSLA